MSIDCTFLQEMIDQTKQQIRDYMLAQTNIATGVEQSFTLNTGQTVTTVTKFNIMTLQNAIDALFNRLEMLCLRCPQPGSGSNGALIMRPAW